MPDLGVKDLNIIYFTQFLEGNKNLIPLGKCGDKDPTGLQELNPNWIQIPDLAVGKFNLKGRTSYEDQDKVSQFHVCFDNFYIVPI